MQHITRQLEAVRRTGRWMLVGQRVSQWLAGVAAAALILGAVDYVLRLPSYLRLVIGLAAAAGAGLWLIGGLRRALAFSPGLDQLALRLERLYPQLAGSLATAVDFTTHAEHYRSPRHTADLVGAALTGVRERMAPVDARALLDTMPTLRLGLLMVLALALLGGAVALAPGHASIAAQRWFAPLGEAQWPRRTQVSAAESAVVWPIDTPLRLGATVERGYEAGMRVEAHYRILAPESGVRVSDAWQSPLMTEQTATEASSHLFERQIEVPEALVRSLQQIGGAATVEYFFRAGDDQTQVRRLSLVARPQVTGLSATVAPPAYAAGLVAVQSVDLFSQSGQTPTISALQGSMVELRATFNKPTAQLTGDQAMSFVLAESVEFPLRLVDEHGLTNLSERRYRIEAIQDKPPTVSLVRPAVDEAVLPTAVVAIEAVAQDDVAAERVHIESLLERLSASAEPAAGGAARAETLAMQTGRAPQLSAAYSLDLATMSVQPGDTVVLTGVAADIFDLDGTRHEPARSAPRRLRIIDEAALIQQLRTELAAVRQQAVRLEQSQRTLMEAQRQRAAAEQADITRRLSAQQELVQSLIDRAQRNRLEEPAMGELMQSTAGLVDEAADASGRASEKLDEADAQAHEAARPDQQRVAEKLGELVALLDQGRDALSLQLKLRQMQAAQSNLAEEARRLFPQTVGQETQDLPQPLRDALSDLEQKQQAMSEQAADLARQMQESAHALAQQPDDRSQAAAQALAEAAAIAQRQGLEQSMRRSAEAIGENQLSQAGADQAQSMDTLSQMLSQMGTQQDRMMAMLRRRLQALAEAIEQLIQRQKDQIALLNAAQGAQALPPLEPAQSAVRRSTMAAQERARAAETEPVAAPLGQAVEAQGRAVLSLRGGEAPGAREAEAGALAALETALQRVRELEQQAAQEEAREAREELKAQYEKLAERQTSLREAVSPLAGLDQPSRRQRADLVDLGHQQADVQAAAEELGRRVEDTLVFRHLHQRIDVTAGEVAAKLRSGAADQLTLADQQRVATLLRTMAAALDPGERDEPFAGQPAGGGSGGGASQPPLVPPIAELKLLRGMQQALYDQTRAADEAGAAADDVLIDLSARQRELAGLGERLMERVRQAQPGGPAQQE